MDINVTSQLLDDVFLHCRVNDLREKMVSVALYCSLLNMLRALLKIEIFVSRAAHSSHSSSAFRAVSTMS